MPSENMHKFMAYKMKTIKAIEKVGGVYANQILDKYQPTPPP